MSFLKAWFVTALLLLSWLFVDVSPAFAASATDDESAIESAIQDGIALRRAGNDEGALTLFLELERQSPGSVRVLLHVTAAAQATGRWLLAHQYLRKASAFKNDAYYVRNRAAIKSVEDAVARHVAQFRVLGQPAGAQVRLSGNLIGTLPFKEPVAVELGSYVLEVDKPGYYPLRRDVTLNTGGTLSQEIVDLGVNDGPTEYRPVGRGAMPAPAGTTDSAHGSEPRWWQSRAVTWSLAGVALAGAATSGIALAVRERKIERWNDDNLCIDRQNVSRSREDVCGGERDGADAAATVALTGGVVAAVFATATLTHWLTTPAKVDKQADRATGPSCGIGVANIVCYGTF